MDNGNAHHHENSKYFEIHFELLKWSHRLAMFKLHGLHAYLLGRKDSRKASKAFIIVISSLMNERNTFYNCASTCDFIFQFSIDSFQWEKNSIFIIYFVFMSLHATPHNLSKCCFCLFHLRCHIFN